MKLSMMIGCCGAVIMTAAVLLGQTETNKTRNSAGHKSDGDNAADVASANLEQAKEMPEDGMVVPPTSEQALTLEDAIRDVMRQAGKQIGTVSSNGIEKLQMPYQQQGNRKVKWDKLLRRLLSGVGYSYTEDDGDLVLFGLIDEVDIKHKRLAQERLAWNRTPISFTTNKSEGGMDLHKAIRDVEKRAGVLISTDYMEPADLYVPVQPATSEGKLTAEQIGKAKDKSVAQQTRVKRTKFDTNGQQIEWRSVLREILNPFDYDFVEVDGIVRIAKKSKLDQWEKESLAKKPLTAKVIRLYHADPEAVVERMKNIKGLLRHPNASLQATRKMSENAEVVKNQSTQIQTGTGQKVGMNDTSSQVFNELVRPRTVPAIIAYDVAENMVNIEEKVRLFDIKEKQVLIEAVIFRLTTDNGKGDTDGVKWEGFENFTPLYGSVGNALAASQYANLIARDGFKIRDGRQLWMRTDGFDFKATIQMIREHKNAKLLSSPMLVVGDHSQAAIQVSQIDPVPDPESNMSSFGVDSSRESVNLEWLMVRSGILMWVSPEITENGTSVRLTVHPQVVEKLDPVKFTFAINGKETEFYNYPLAMHEMDTRATVPSGATLMFGGLIDNEEVEVETKVRWLGDIPLIGWLFRSKEMVTKQDNLIIMIRPTILEDADSTGFEKNALQETKSVMVNSGRDLKKTSIGGPYSIKEIKNNANAFYNERIAKPFTDDGLSEENSNENIKK